MSLIPAVALALACLAMVGAHYVVGLNYPINRTGLWLMILFGIVWALAAGNSSNRLALGANLALAAALTVQFATQFHADFFQVYWYDRSTKEIARRIEAEIRGKPPGSISIGATWLHQPALEYYRVHDKVAALQQVARRIPTELTGHDYYVLSKDDRFLPQALNRTTLFSDSFAEVVLMK